MGQGQSDWTVVAEEDDEKPQAATSSGWQVMGEEDDQKAASKDIDKATSLSSPFADRPAKTASLDLGQRPTSVAERVFGEERENKYGAPLAVTPTGVKPVPDLPSLAPPSKPKTPSHLMDRAPATPVRARDIAASAIDSLTNPEPGAETGLPNVGSMGVEGATQLTTPGERMAGASKVINAFGEATSPIMGPAVLENPVPVITGLGTGTAASAAGGAIADAAGADPDTKEFVKTAAFWFPTILGEFSGIKGAAVEGDEGTAVGASAFGGRVKGAVKVTPGEVTVGGKVGPFEGSKTFSRGEQPVPGQPTIEPQTIEGQVVPPEQAHPAVVEREAQRAQAAATAVGIPPEPPPAPPDAVMTQETVSQVAAAIAKLPPELRPQAMIEAHGTMTKILSGVGKAIGPDGKLEVITTEESASRIAQRWVNNAVAEADSALDSQRRGGASKDRPETSQATYYNENKGVPESPSSDGSDLRQASSQVESPQGRLRTDRSEPQASAETLPGTGQTFGIDDLRSHTDERMAGNDTLSPSGDLSTSETAPAVSTDGKPDTGASLRHPAKESSAQASPQPYRDASQLQHRSSPTPERSGESNSRFRTSGKYAQAPLSSGDEPSSSSQRGPSPASASPLSEEHQASQKSPGQLTRSGTDQRIGQESIPLANDIPSGPADNGGFEILNEEDDTPAGEKSGYAKGDQVKTLVDRNGVPAGTVGTVAHAGAGVKFVRVKANGKNISYGLKEVQAHQGEAPTGINAQETPPVSSKNQPLTDNPSTLSTNVNEQQPQGFHGEGVSTELENPLTKPAPANLEHGFDTRPVLQTPEPDLGEKARAELPPIPRGERRKQPRTPEEQQTQELFKQARTELGEDASSDDVMARVEELKGKPTTIGIDDLPDGVTPKSPERLAHEEAFTHRMREIINQKLSQEQSAGGKSEETGKPAETAKEPIHKPAEGDELGRPSSVRLIDPKKLHTDPARFQWRLVPRGAIPESAPWDQTKAGPLDAWRDPADNKLYVIEGHHRHSHAIRTKAPEVEFRLHEFKNAAEARQFGALRNIELGNATPFDAALYLRESKLDAKQLEARGVNLTGDVLRKGTALANLSSALWEKYRTGDLDEAKSVAIGSSLDDPAQQDAMAKIAKSQHLSAGELEQIARRIKDQGNTSTTMEGLFGTEENSQSNAIATAKVSLKVEKALQTDKAALKYIATASEARKAALERGKNIVNLEKSGEEAMLASALAEHFRRAQNKVGEISRLLDDAGRRVTAGEPLEQVFKDIYPRVRQAVTDELDSYQSGGSPANQDSARDGAPGRQEADDQTKPLFAQREPYSVHEEDGYVKVRHPEHGTVAAGKLGDDGRVHNIEFTNPKFQKSNAIRQPAMRALQSFENDKQGGLPLFSPQALAPTFYSKAEQVVTAKLPNAASGQAMIATLKNNGVKADELKWLGLDELAGRLKKVTKEEVLQTIRENNLGLKDVKLGRRTPEQQQAIDEAKEKRDAANQRFIEVATREFRDKLGVPDQPPPYKEWLHKQPWFLSGANGDNARARELYEEWKSREREGGQARNLADMMAQEISTSTRSASGIIYDRFGRKRVMDTIAKDLGYGGWTSQLTPAQQREVEQAYETQETANSKQLTELYEAGRDLFNYSSELRWKRQDNQTPTKYEQYTLPGEKKGYTELLITLPQKQAEFEPLTELPEDYETAVDNSQGPDRKYQVLPPGQIHARPFAGRHATPEEARAKALEYLNHLRRYEHSDEYDRNQFKSSHFDQPNILAHVRFDERTDADGNRVLLVEEVQSDWHQKGKKEGYRKPRESFDDWRKRISAESGIDVEDTPQERHIYESDTGYQALRAGGVPDAPYKSDWHELALKRMIREAAEQGYDKLAWVTGEQTAERYDLSKSIARIEYDNDGVLTAYGKDTGQEVIRRAVPEDQLEDVIGKDAAKKLLAEPMGKYSGYRMISGIDLKVGGEWAKNLYDKAILNFLSKYGKKWGAKVGQSKLVAGTDTDRVYDGPQFNEDEMFDFARSHEGTVIHGSAHSVALEMQDGRTFVQAMDTFGSEALAEALGGKMTFNRPHMAQVHHLEITPEMKQSVLHEGQLFKPATGPLEPATAKKIRFEVAPTAEGLPSYIRMNGPAAMAVGRAIGVSFWGVNMGSRDVMDVVNKLMAEADTLAKGRHEEAEHAVRSLALAMVRNVDNDAGLNMVMATGDGREIKTLHEELLHSVMQRKPGKGRFEDSVPLELMKDPGMARIAAETVGKLIAHNVDPHPTTLVAEGMVDIMLGEAAEHINSYQASKTATKYFEALADQHGIQPIEDALAVERYISEFERVNNVTHNRNEYAVRQAAIASARNVLSRRSGKGTEAGSGGVSQGSLFRKPGSSSPAGATADSLRSGALERSPSALEKSASLHSTAPVGLTDEELELWSKAKGFRVEPAGEQLGMFGDNQQVYRVFRQGAKGKEERGLVYESQLEKLQKEAEPEAPLEPFALTAPDAPKEDDQPRLFGAGDMGEIIGGKPQAPSLFPDTEKSPDSLFRGTSGQAQPGKILQAASGAAGVIGDYLREGAFQRRTAHNLEQDLFDLEPQYDADVLRAVQTMEKVGKELGKAAIKDYEAVYHHLEDQSVSLTPAQDKLLDETVIPIMDDTDEKYTALKKLMGTKDVQLIENYVHRVVKGKGSFFDRIIARSRGNGKGNLLSKSAPQTKTRTMMALEDTDGKRAVVSIKGGIVTKWSNGKPEDIGGLRSGMTTREGILHDKVAEIQREIRKLQHERKILMESPARIKVTFARRKNITEAIDKLEREKDSIIASVAPSELDDQVFVDSKGKEWKLTQATTKEIEANTALTYYHNALASALISNLQVGKALRAAQLIADFKTSPEFAQVAFKGPGSPPKGWRTTKVQQFTGYSFEPHVADVLDYYQARLGKDGPNVFDKIGKFLRTSIFFNPLLHIPNIANHALVERGVSGGLRPVRMVHAGTRALNAVIHQNQDYLDLLDAGAPLQSHRDDIAELNKLFFQQLTEGEKNGEPWALKIAKALGTPITGLYKVSGKATWLANDLFYATAVFEKIAAGMTMKDAIRETSKHIPDYRIPARILNSTSISKLMRNPTLTMFGGYHYGALKSYGETVKSALGMGDIPEPTTVTVRTKTASGWQEQTRVHGAHRRAEDMAKAWERLAWAGVVTFVLYNLADELLRKVTGDKDAHLRRAGASTFLYNVQQYIKGQKNEVDLLQSIATPAVHTWNALQLATNRDFYTGRHIWDPHADWHERAQQIGRKLVDSIAPASQGMKMAEDQGARRKFAYGLVGVSFPKSGAEKVAGDIARDKLPMTAEDPDNRKKWMARKNAAEGLRKGDSSALSKGLEDGTLDMDQAEEILTSLQYTPLQKQVNGFTFDEVVKVYEAAVKDGNKQQQEELIPILIRKQESMLDKGKEAELPDELTHETATQ